MEKIQDYNNKLKQLKQYYEKLQENERTCKLITCKNNKSRYKLKTMSKHYDFPRTILRN